MHKNAVLGVGVDGLLAAALGFLVASGFVAGAASAVAGSAGWDEVVGCVAAASVLFDEVIGFGCWGCAAPVTER